LKETFDSQVSNFLTKESNISLSTNQFSTPEEKTDVLDTNVREEVT
jgi:hypothetical protein